MDGLHSIILMLFYNIVLGAELADLENYNSDVLPDTDLCGFQDDLVRIIYSGSETKRFEYPWLAALEYQDKYFRESDVIKCAGFVITKRYILTAAHCVYFRRFDLIKIWLGVWKISEADTVDKDIVKKYNIEERILHESYENTIKGYDIALLKLDEDVIFNEYIRPICLPKQDLKLLELGAKLIVAGWGSTETEFSSDVKLKTDVPVAAREKCNKYTTMLDDIQICAGGKEGKDSCIGDSGGPLMDNIFNEMTGKNYWYPQGIVSFGQGCGIEDTPGVYTRVSKFTDWILNKVK